MGGVEHDLDDALPLAQEHEAGSKELPMAGWSLRCSSNLQTLDLLIRERERTGMEGNGEGEEGKRTRRCGVREALQRWQMGDLQRVN
jgi:hypothetical protein